MDPLIPVIRTAAGLGLVRRIRDALTRRLGSFQNSLARKLAPDERIAAGPFAGMIFPVRKIESSVILPKLLGSYEEELHAEIERIARLRYSDVLDIGCGEGYYAVGLALRIAGARVQAFDLDPIALRSTSDLASLNGVSDRVTVTYGCSAPQLSEMRVGQRVLIVSDCEGAELDLLKPAILPQAASIDLLVECHECGDDSSISDELRRRFATSHEALVIQSSVRVPSKYPLLNGWSSGELELALSESRPPGMRWLSLVQKDQPNCAA